MSIMLDIFRFSKCQFGVTAGNRRKRGVAYGWGRNSTFRPASPVREGIARRYSKKIGVSASNRVSVDWYDNFLNTEAVFAHLPFASKDVNWRHAARRRNLTAINHAAVRPVEPDGVDSSCSNRRGNAPYCRCLNLLMRGASPYK